MSTGNLGAALEELQPVGLEELIACASLQTRVDRKYVLPVDMVEALLGRLPSGTRVLDIDGDRSFAYRSLYFDTPELTSYLLTAHRRRRRFKIRTRLYEQSGDCWLEVKVRGNRGSTVKQRLPYEPRDWNTLGPGRDFVDEILAENRIAGSPLFDYVPTLTTRYHRTTLHLPDTNSRVTIDTGLTWVDGDREMSLPDTVIVETKTGSTASHVDRLLWRSRYRPSRISKYATGLAALRPHLPDGPWRRTLRRHFPPDAPRTAPGAEPRITEVPATGSPDAAPVCAPLRERVDAVMSR
ncbi:polyphosphate polymerase domain-containing protein [Streptomyces sp. TRM 70361]|uniref:polyphosphate polymerase domain-containing protein n=1 Tax=Streptomyces sp. TRM 70361 TaxID=3116553 RepID=UPI002E7B6247|nr:polyphosphate polymerase domain-containing protein [Streptomyces sp. TRM 70361]MEE1938962.1 polyphosphate polymerase domain-containing protein [Streptomyces sp. TRM 70361]